MKNAAAYLKENAAAGYRLYHNAITDRTNAAFTDWANYMIKIITLHFVFQGNQAYEKGTDRIGFG